MDDYEPRDYEAEVAFEADRDLEADMQFERQRDIATLDELACTICGANPMTANCNNAGCDK